MWPPSEPFARLGGPSLAKWQSNASPKVRR
jgi:hypothetical protein